MQKKIILLREKAKKKSLKVEEYKKKKLYFKIDNKRKTQNNKVGRIEDKF